MASNRAKTEVRRKWVRDGTFISGSDTQIDLRNRTGSVWITIKAKDNRCEREAERLLDFLNSDAVPEKVGDG